MYFRKGKKPPCCGTAAQERSEKHNITECFGLEGTFRGHLAHPLAASKDIFNQTRLLRAPSNLALNVSRDGASTTSLGSLFQCLTTLIKKLLPYI